MIAEDHKSAEVIKPFLAGRDIKRYQTPEADKFLILFPKGITAKNIKSSRETSQWLSETYPAIARHLEPYEAKGKKRYDKGDYWWELRTCDYYAAFEGAKIIIPAIVKSASYTFDKTGIYSNDKTSIIATDDLYLLGVLNLKVSDFLMHSISSTKQGGYFEYKPMYVSQLPIPQAPTPDPISPLVEQMLSLNKQLASAKTAHEKTALQRQIEATDNQIDKLVYELYGLTEEEIKIVESK